MGVNASAMSFKFPDYYCDEGVVFDMSDSGEKQKKFGNIRWFTNIDHGRRNIPIVMYETYVPDKYPKYDNVDAIEVMYTKLIPRDYNGVMGVPISFMDKYCPEQFEIIGKMTTTKVDEYNFGYPYINGKKKYNRILIRRKQNEN